jgi:hypothetical protein
MEEICSQVLQLRDIKDEIPLNDRARLCARLTREWVAEYRKLRGVTHV